MIRTPLEIIGNDLPAMKAATKTIVEAEGLVYKKYDTGRFYICEQAKVSGRYFDGKPAYKNAPIMEISHGVLPMEIALDLARQRKIEWHGGETGYSRGCWFDRTHGGQTTYCDAFDHLALLEALVKSYGEKK